MTNNFLGRVFETFHYPVPQISDYRREWRTITKDDSAIVVPDESQTMSPINLTNSRFAVGNVVLVLVGAGHAGVKVALYAVDGGVTYWLADQTTNQANQVLTFKDMPALPLAIQVTGVTEDDTVTLSVGATK